MPRSHACLLLTWLQTARRHALQGMLPVEFRLQSSYCGRGRCVVSRQLAQPLHRGERVRNVHAGMAHGHLHDGNHSHATTKPTCRQWSIAQADEPPNPLHGWTSGNHWPFPVSLELVSSSEANKLVMPSPPSSLSRVCPATKRHVHLGCWAVTRGVPQSNQIPTCSYGQF
jgi:hypothetical protein